MKRTYRKYEVPGKEEARKKRAIEETIRHSQSKLASSPIHYTQEDISLLLEALQSSIQLSGSLLEELKKERQRKEECKAELEDLY